MDNGEVHGLGRYELGGFIPWTSRGIILGIGSAGLLWWTYGYSHDYVVRVMGLCGLGMPIIALFLVFGVARQVRKGIRLAVGNGLRCGALIAPQGSLLTIKFREPPVDENGFLCRRGKFGRITYRLSDPFQLVQIKRSIDQDVTVSPGISCPSPAWQPFNAPQAGEEWGPGGRPGDEMMEIGQYQNGDPIKNILWKINARTGGLKTYVRRPELTVSTKVAYYFCAGKDDDLSAEFFNHQLTKNLTGEMDIYGFSTEPGQTVTTRSQALELLTESGKAPEVYVGDYEQFQQEIARNQVSLCVVMLPASKETLKIKRDLGGHRVPTRFVACIEYDQADDDSAEWSRHDVETVRMERDPPA